MKINKNKYKELYRKTYTVKYIDYKGVTRKRNGYDLMIMFRSPKTKNEKKLNSESSIYNHIRGKRCSNNLPSSWSDISVSRGLATSWKDISKRRYQWKEERDFKWQIGHGRGGKK